jgi:hypothetical protein
MPGDIAAPVGVNQSRHHRSGGKIKKHRIL